MIYYFFYKRKPLAMNNNNDDITNDIHNSDGNLCIICYTNQLEVYSECNHRYCICCLSRLKKCAFCNKVLNRFLICKEIVNRFPNTNQNQECNIPIIFMLFNRMRMASRLSASITYL